MNRIILIGNGFDLAHGLKTKYEHFIEYFWKKRCEEINDKKLDYDFFSLKAYTSDFNGGTYNELAYHLNSRQNPIIFKNKFLEIITQKAYPTKGDTTLTNWVDIENEYFEQLRGLIKNPLKSEFKNIANLNKCFEVIKQALEKYLDDIEQPLKNDTILNHIYSYFMLKDFTQSGLSRLREEIGTKSEKLALFDECVRAIVKGNKYEQENLLTLRPDNTLFLTFNYTETEHLYLDISINDFAFDSFYNTPCDSIHIHGELNNKQNPIIFGYGDEQDEMHKEIEKRGGDYLENIKTINYLKTSNYKKLLNFIEGGMYQIFIMGHSCGMSDKTLLKTLFEHNNCVSIKPFYYEWKDEKDIKHDNYDDIVKNIYRIFSDKALMRAKVLNKKDCICLLK
jgi:hypothetical protein